MNVSFFRKFDRIDNQMNIWIFIVIIKIISIFIRIVIIIFVKMMRNVSRLKSLVFLQEIVIFDIFIDELLFDLFFLFFNRFEFYT